MNPLFSTSGYTLNDHVLRILQREGWIEIPLDGISELKIPFASSATVKLADGRRWTLDLTHLNLDAYHEVIAALRDAAKSRRSLPKRNSENET